MRRIAALLAGLTLAGSASAHPHIYIDSGLHLVFDGEGRLAAVRVVWAYDEFYSLLVLEDLGLDPDADGVLTDAEVEKLNGFDMQWVEGFEGDLYALEGEAPLALGGPLEWTTRMQQGRIVSMHTRAFEAPVEVGADPVVLQVYDPSFYTAYTIALPTRIAGREGCQAQLYRPDLDAAGEELLAALAELGAMDTVEDAGFPAVGANFADEIRVTCAPRS